MEQRTIPLLLYYVTPIMTICTFFPGIIPSVALPSSGE